MATIASGMDSQERGDAETIQSTGVWILGLLGSLKLTVALFALSLVNAAFSGFPFGVRSVVDMYSGAWLSISNVG